MEQRSPEQQLAEFAARYTPEIEEQIHDAHKIMREMLPGAIEMVYDNYNALVIGFCPTERVADVLFSIAVYPRYITLFFANGVDLPDPRGMLCGSGVRVRHIQLKSPDDLRDPAIRELMSHALQAGAPLDASQRNKLVIKSISAKQRPRRPA